MTEWENKDYAEYIYNNGKIVHITQEEAELFVRKVIELYETDGKDVALDAMDKFDMFLQEQGTLFYTGKSAFFVGLMTANEIINKEEADRLNGYFLNRYTERLKEKARNEREHS